MNAKLCAWLLEATASAILAGLLWHLNSPWWGYLVALFCGRAMNAARKVFP